MKSQRLRMHAPLVVTFRRDPANIYTPNGI